MPSWRRRPSLNKQKFQQKDSRAFTTWNPRNSYNSDSDDSEGEVQVSYQHFAPIIEVDNDKNKQENENKNEIENTNYVKKHNNNNNNNNTNNNNNNDNFTTSTTNYSSNNNNNNNIYNKTDLNDTQNHQNLHSTTNNQSKSSPDVEMAIVDSDDSDVGEVNTSVQRFQSGISSSHRKKDYISNTNTIPPSPSPSPPSQASVFSYRSKVGRRLNFEGEDDKEEEHVEDIKMTEDNHVQSQGEGNSEPVQEQRSGIFRRHSLFSPQTRELMGMRLFPASEELEEQSETNNNNSVNNNNTNNYNQIRNHLQDEINNDDIEEKEDDDFDLYFPSHEPKQHSKRRYRSRRVNSALPAHPSTSSYLRPSSTRATFLKRIENQELEEDIESFSSDENDDNQPHQQQQQHYQQQQQYQNPQQLSSSSSSFYNSIENPSNTGKWMSFQYEDIDDDDDDGNDLPPVPLPSRKSPLTPSPSKNKERINSSSLRKTQNRSPASNQYNLSRRMRSLNSSSPARINNNLSAFHSTSKHEEHDHQNDIRKRSYSAISPSRSRGTPLFSSGSSIAEPPYKRSNFDPSIIQQATFVEDIEDDSQFDDDQDHNNNNNQRHSSMTPRTPPPSSHQFTPHLPSSLTTPPTQSGSDWINSIRTNKSKSVTPKKSKFHSKRRSRRGGNSVYTEMLQNALTSAENDHFHRRHYANPQMSMPRPNGAEFPSSSPVPSPAGSQTSVSSSHSSMLERDSVAVQILREEYHGDLVATICNIVGPEDNHEIEKQHSGDSSDLLRPESCIDVYFLAHVYEERNFGIGAVVRIFRPFQEYPASVLFPRAVISCTIITELEKSSFACR